MLPPDNFQEDPRPVVAHRTSPTNIGLYLLSVVAARDFGWLGTLDTLERVEATLATMDRMDRFRGHFYNWYETRDLHPLEPKYISSVDSGNLAGHLIALANACRAMVNEPIVNPDWAAGLEDGLSLVRELALADRGHQGTRDAAQAGFDTAHQAGRRWTPPSTHQPRPKLHAASPALRRRPSRSMNLRAAGRTRRRRPGVLKSRYGRTLCGPALRRMLSISLLSLPWAKLIAQDPPPADVMHVLDVIPSLDALPRQCEAALKALGPYRKGKAATRIWRQRSKIPRKQAKRFCVA